MFFDKPKVLFINELNKQPLEFVKFHSKKRWLIAHLF